MQINYTQFLNTIFALNFEDQKATEILLNCSKAWVRANSNIRKLYNNRKNNSLTAYYVDSKLPEKKLTDYFGNENRSLTSLFWTAVSTKSLPGRHNMSAPAFNYRVQVMVETEKGSTEIQDEVSKDRVTDKLEMKSDRQPTPSKDGTSGWEQVHLTPENSFFVSSYLEEFVYSLVASTSDFTCIQFKNAEKAELPKVAFYSPH